MTEVRYVISQTTRNNPPERIDDASSTLESTLQFEDITVTVDPHDEDLGEGTVGRPAPLSVPGFAEGRGQPQSSSDQKHVRDSPKHVECTQKMHTPVQVDLLTEDDALPVGRDR